MVKYNVPAIVTILLKVAVTLSVTTNRAEANENHPFLVDVYELGQFKCAGTLVHKYFVATPIRCLIRVDEDSLTIKATGTSYSGKGVKSLIKLELRVSEIIIPNEFDIFRSYEGVALLKLEKGIPERLIKPAVLCSKEFGNGAVLRLYGRGVQTATGDSEKIHSVEVQAIDRSTCQNIYPDSPLPKTMLCAKVINKGLCNIAPGSPAIIGNEFCGITEIFKGCEPHATPTILTSVYNLRSSIMKTISKNFKVSKD